MIYQFGFEGSLLIFFLYGQNSKPLESLLLLLLFYQFGFEDLLLIFFFIFIN
jgi:hypothetical protein